MIKITSNSKLFIWGTSKDVRSGGAEVLNLLAATLKRLGANAKMFSWDQHYYEQAPYYKERYDVNTTTWEEITDTEDTIILIPECMIENPDNTKFFADFKYAQLMIWWLGTSYDYNDLSKKNSHKLEIIVLSVNKKILHLCESEETMRDLNYRKCMNTIKLQHGCNEVFFNKPSVSTKRNCIMYNSMKELTRNFMDKYIIPRMPDVEFKPIVYLGPDNFLSKEQLCDEYYDVSKIYIDACGFEGRELMPREACLRNCILFLQNFSCAQHFQDYPIDEYYKFNYCDDPDILVNKLYDALETYDSRLEDFALMKRKFLQEPINWELQLKMIFGPMIPQT